MPYFPIDRNAPVATIHDALVAAAEHRRLTALERRILRLTAPLPWREAGVCRTTWYRRRNRALPLASVEEAV